MGGYRFRMFLLVAIVIVQFAFFTCITSTQFGMSTVGAQHSVLGIGYCLLGAGYRLDTSLTYCTNR